MKRYRTAVIGAGFIGMAHIEALRRLGNVEVVALCDVSGCAEKADAVGIPAAFTDYREMIETVRPDAIHICVPNFLHYQVAEFAVSHGVNVLCEKPFTVTVEEAEALARQAQRADVRGMVNFHNRFYPMAREMREQCRAGEFGDLITVHGSYLQDWLLWDTDYTWRLDSSMSGRTRAVSDIGSHWLDLAEFVTGMQITAVMAQFSTYYRERKKPKGRVESFSTEAEEMEYDVFPVDTEDCASILLRFENGAIGSLTISQMFPGKKNQMRFALAGTRRSAEWDSEDLQNLSIGRRDGPNLSYTKDTALVTPGAGALVSYPAGHAEGFPDAFKQGFRQFYASIGNPDGEYQYATFEDGLREMVLCDRIFESAKQNVWMETGRSTK